MACVSCSLGDHFGCSGTRGSGKACCCNGTPEPLNEEIEDSDDRRRTRRHGRDASLKDQQSTGRKRAAIAFPLDREAACEWQGLRFAGGGQFPIIGCSSGKQQARHHGPDKNTLNNEEGNVHRICHFCHNRWHTVNDSKYTPGDPGPSHDSKTKATIEEIMNNELYWASHQTVKAKD